MAFKTTSDDTLRSSGKENLNDSGRTIGAAILEKSKTTCLVGHTKLKPCTKDELVNSKKRLYMAAQFQDDSI